MPDSLIRLAAKAESIANPIARASYLHGPKHWHAVARVGAMLLSQVPDADPRSLFLFAAVHDTQRLNDGHDPEHGARAATVLSKLITAWGLSN